MPARRVAVTSFCRPGAVLLSMLLVAGASASAQSRRASPRPPEVPDDYVVTPNGYMHPSCVVTVGPDEVVGADLVVRGRDGTVHRTLEPCDFPRYSALGRILPERESITRPTPLQRTADAGFGSDAGPGYDGWLAAFFPRDTVVYPTPVTVSDKWRVPLVPTNGAANIFYFNGITTHSDADGSIILQPVLGSVQGSPWEIRSVICCQNNSQQYSTAVAVAPGDIIEGTIAGNDCDTTGVCLGWTVTTTDLTTGLATILQTSDPDPYGPINPGVLETYLVSSCDDLPPGGEETFFDHSITDASGATPPLVFDFSSFPEGNAPACGYAGTSSGDHFTLIYSNTPSLIAPTMATVAQGESASFVASGSVGTDAWSITPGDAGVSINASGVVTATSEAALQSYTVQVTDSVANTATATLEVVPQPGAPVAYTNGCSCRAEQGSLLPAGLLALLVASAARRRARRNPSTPLAERTGTPSSAST